MNSPRKTTTPKRPGNPTAPPPGPGPSLMRIGTAPHAPGEGGGAQTQLRLPHERDQSIDSTHPRPDPVIEQAARDLAAGQVDTDLRATPGLDAERRRHLLRQPSRPPRQRR